MSQSFLDSMWCQREFDEAYRKNKLIVIMMTPSSTEGGALDFDEANAVIKSYVKTFTYLKEEDPDFWNKLAYHLPHKAMPSTNMNSTPNWLRMIRSFLSHSTSKVQQNHKESEQMSVLKAEDAYSKSTSNGLTTTSVQASDEGRSLINGSSSVITAEVQT